MPQEPWRFIGLDVHKASVEGGDIAYAQDFFTQSRAAGRFQLAAMQVADVATPLSEILLASRALSCGDDVMRVVVIEALDGDDYYDDLGRRIEQALVDGDSLTWQYESRLPNWQYDAPAISMQFGDEAVSRSISIDPIQLQSKWKHSSALGLTGNWNKTNAELYADAIRQHVKNPAVQQLPGTWHGISAYHYYDSSRNVLVITDRDGIFITLFKPSAEQKRILFSTGNLGGG